MSSVVRPVKILLLADSHLGFDHPVRPRVRRRRRGEDFLANHRTALRTALDEKVDLVVHGGDVFHCPGIPASLVHQAFAPLKDVADAGIPVFVVPGNHERSRIPFDWIARHPLVHVFKEPGTVRLDVKGIGVAVSGIPCIRRDARTRFPGILEETGWREVEASVRLLVVHQALEGATVGPSDFTFRHGHDTIRLRDLPADFSAVLAGHIHRHQVLETDLAGRPAPVPVFYPGSVERTAFAEMDEEKGFVVMEVSPSGAVGGWSFRSLYARPMRRLTLRLAGLAGEEVVGRLAALLSAEPADAVLRVEVEGTVSAEARRALSAESLRRVAPATMNVDLVIPGERSWRGRRKRVPRPTGPPRLQLELGAPAAMDRPGPGTPHSTPES